MCGVKLLSVVLGIVAIIFGLLRRNHIRLNELRGASPSFVMVNNITPEDFPTLQGKVMIVTGANVGLGKSTAKILANQGATVILGCRSMRNCDKAKASIRAEIAQKNLYTNSNVSTTLFAYENLVPMQLDLSDFNSLRNFAKEFQEKYNRLDSLILNAGVAHTRFFLTKDIIEGQIGVNHFGHFLLTKLLRPQLEATEPSTVVVVSSGSHRSSYEGGIKESMFLINDPMDYDPVLSYGQSKLANILFAQELAKRMKESGKRVYVNSLNPGFVHTAISRHKSKHIRNFVLPIVKSLIGFKSDDACLLTVYLAISPSIIENKVTGKYFIQMGEIQTPHHHALNETLQKRLWELSEKVTNRKSIIK